MPDVLSPGWMRRTAPRPLHHDPVLTFILNEEACRKMFTVKLMKGSEIHLYYAERVVVNNPKNDDRSVWLKWAETAEGGGTTVYEDTFYVDGQQFDFCVVEQGGKTVEVVRTMEQDRARRKAS